MASVTDAELAKMSQEERVAALGMTTEQERRGAVHLSLGARG